MIHFRKYFNQGTRKGASIDVRHRKYFTGKHGKECGFGKTHPGSFHHCTHIKNCTTGPAQYINPASLKWHHSNRLGQDQDQDNLRAAAVDISLLLSPRHLNISSRLHSTVPYDDEASLCGSIPGHDSHLLLWSTMPRLLHGTVWETTELQRSLPRIPANYRPDHGIR